MVTPVDWENGRCADLSLGGPGEAGTTQVFGVISTALYRGCDREYRRQSVSEVQDQKNLSWGEAAAGHILLLPDRRSRQFYCG